jgi:hypothetical protein
MCGAAESDVLGRVTVRLLHEDGLITPEEKKQMNQSWGAEYSVTQKS